MSITGPAGVEPMSLEERLAREQRLSPREAVRIGVDLARAVEQRHRQGVRTCPISPATIALKGQAVILAPDSGKSSYPSPEEMAGHPADERTDIYRLGAVMYQMLAGSAPPAPEAPKLITGTHRLRPAPPPPSVHAVRRDVSRALDAAISRALSRDPRDRFARASQLAEMLEESLKQRLEHEPHSDRPSQAMIADSWEFQEEERRIERRGRRSYTKRKAILALVVLTIVLVVVLLT